MAVRKRASAPREQTIDFDWVPTEKQAPMVASSAMIKLGGGARGGGKTDFLARMAVTLSIQFPGNKGFMGRRDLSDFRSSTMEALLRSIPKGLCVEPCPHEQKKEFRLRTPRSIESGDPDWESTILYGELKDAGSILSGEIGWFAIDEAYEVPRLSFDHLSGSMRRKLPDGTVPPMFGLLASNPSPGWLMDLFPVTEEEQAAYNALVAQYGDGWLPQRFPTPFNPQKMLDYDYAYFPFRAEDNPHLPPGYLERLIKTYQHDPVLLARMVYGRWDVTMQGLVYQLLQAHRWNPRRPGQRLYRQGVPVLLGIDPSNGAGNYAATVVQTHRDRILLVGEYKRQGGNDDDFLDWLHHQPFANQVADAVSDSARPDTIRRLRAKGLPVRSSGKKDVTAQINTVKSLMQVRPETGDARLLVDESQCPQFIREMGLRSYKQMSNDMNTPEQPLKKYDDLLNSFEYLASARWAGEVQDEDGEYARPVRHTPIYLVRHNILRAHRR